MEFDKSSAIEQLEPLVAMIEPRITLNRGIHWYRGTTSEATLLRTRCVAAVERLAPPGSRYVLDATTESIVGGQPGAALPKLAGILRALRDDFEAGYMRRSRS